MLLVDKQKIEVLQAQKNYSGFDFSKHSGLSRQHISTIKNRGTCTPQSAAKLAQALGVDVTEILTASEGR